MQDDAEATLRQWQNDIKERELAEKRRVAPGWLDREEKILEPVRRPDPDAQSENIMDMEDSGPVQQSLTQARNAEGEALDRAFGDLAVRSRPQ